VVCNTHEGDYKFIHTVSWKNPKGIDNLGDLSEDRIILKFMLKKWREVVDWIQLAQWRSGNLLKTCYELSSPHDVTIQTTRTGTFTAVKASIFVLGTYPPKVSWVRFPARVGIYLITAMFGPPLGLKREADLEKVWICTRGHVTPSWHFI